MSKSKSEWCVVTGGPCFGIDTTLKHFKKIGYPVVDEAARNLIDEEMAKGRTIEEIRKDEREFQKQVLSRKIEIEKNLPRDEIIFLNRAVPDSIAYYRNYGLDPGPVIKLCEKGLYKKIFLLEQLPKFEKGYARTETKQTAKRLGRMIKEAYQQLGYKVILVPVMTVRERVEFIAEFLKKEVKQ